MKKFFNIGCAFFPGVSFENFDASPTLRLERIPILGQFVRKNPERYPDSVKYGDIVKGGLCPDNFASAIFCCHVLEHLPYDDMRQALQHMYQMLASGGVLRVIVPDLHARARAYLDAYASGSADAAGAFMDSCLLGKKESRGLKDRLIDAFGNKPHLWIYDRLSLRRELEAVGFRNLRECKYGDSTIPQFAEIEEADRFIDRGIVEVAFDCEK